MDDVGKILELHGNALKLQAKVTAELSGACSTGFTELTALCKSLVETTQKLHERVKKLEEKEA